MSEYIYKVGDDYESDNKEYLALNTDKGQQISIAFSASGMSITGTAILTRSGMS